MLRIQNVGEAWKMGVGREVLNNLFQSAIFECKEQKTDEDEV